MLLHISPHTRTHTRTTHPEYNGADQPLLHGESVAHLPILLEALDLLVLAAEASQDLLHDGLARPLVQQALGRKKPGMSGLKSFGMVLSGSDENL